MPLLRIGWWAWPLVAALAVIDAAWIAFADWSIRPQGIVASALAVAALLAPLGLARYRRDERLSTTLRAGAVFIAFTNVAALLSYLVVGTNAPLVDARLDAWDRAIGFDWMALLAWMQAHPAIHKPLRFAYHSGFPQIAALLIYLGFTRRSKQQGEFIALFIAAGSIAIVVSGFFPAAGPWTHYTLSSLVDVSPMSHFAPVRDGSLRHFDSAHVQGLISIPSMHTAIAMLLVYAVRGTRLLRPSALLNGLMIAATPIEGGHYLVDVLAGAAMTALLIAISRLPALASAPRPLNRLSLS